MRASTFYSPNQRITGEPAATPAKCTGGAGRGICSDALDYSLTNLIWMLGFIVIVVTIASIGPAWGAARVKVAQTLRYE